MWLHETGWDKHIRQNPVKIACFSSYYKILNNLNQFNAIITIVRLAKWSQLSTTTHSVKLLMQCNIEEGKINFLHRKRQRGHSLTPEMTRVWYFAPSFFAPIAMSQPWSNRFNWMYLYTQLHIYSQSAWQQVKHTCNKIIQIEKQISYNHSLLFLFQHSL